MEEYVTSSSEVTSSESPQLTPEAISYLLTAAKWGKFLAILGFISLGFLLLAGLFMGFIFSLMESHMNSFNGTGMLLPPVWLSIIYILISVISFIPVYFLNAFSNRVTRSARNNDTDSMTRAFRQLKNLFVFAGVYTIVMIVVYVIVIIVIASAAALAV